MFNLLRIVYNHNGFMLLRETVRVSCYVDRIGKMVKSWKLASADIAERYSEAHTEGPVVMRVRKRINSFLNV